MGAAANARMIHAGVVVGFFGRSDSDQELVGSIDHALDQYCELIKNGTDELSDEDVEALRFLTALRTALNAPPEEEAG